MKTLITRGWALPCLCVLLNCTIVTAGVNAQALERYAGRPDTARDLNYNTSVLPLPNAFAHNDYLHRRPLFDALDNGFTNVEADVFLKKNNRLVVAHYFPFFKGGRTLESLYLKPLFERIMRNKGEVFASYTNTVTLLIDIKSDADKTYEALKPLLERYRPILSEYDGRKITYRALTIVLSGHKPGELVEHEQDRLVFIDADLCRLPCNPGCANVFNMASCKYNDLLHWQGEGSMPGFERRTLVAFVTLAHKMGMRVRLWASPEKKQIWHELLNCGVDLINTDQLVMLKNYLAADRLAKSN